MRQPEDNIAGTEARAMRAAAGLYHAYFTGLILTLVTRRSAAFVGYCRQQANKYGIKGSRVAAARKALTLLLEAVERLGS